MAKRPAKKSVSAAKSMKAAPKKKPVPKIHWLAEGYASITPILVMKDPGKALKFYEKAFGFTIKQTIPGPDKTVIHGEMTYEGSTFMMGGENPQQNVFAPSHYKGTSITLYVYTPDVDAFTKKAKKAGAVCIQEPQDMYWGDRVAALVDPEGYAWFFATHVKEVAPEDMRP